MSNWRGTKTVLKRIRCLVGSYPAKILTHQNLRWKGSFIREKCFSFSTVERRGGHTTDYQVREGRTEGGGMVGDGDFTER